jgi:NADP-dependent 3-hydroxy acid dehydrogenase YdfG
MQRLTGKRVLITGASSGIGQAAAGLFVAAGAHVIVTGRTASALEGLARAAPGGAVTTLAGDLNDAAFIAELAARAKPVDVLVNGAGALKHAPILESDPADWERVFEINVLTLLRVTQAVARDMAARGSGHIINISSMVARRVVPNTTIYSATKHAVAAISQGLRHELRQFGVRVTEIAPGVTSTNVFRDLEHPTALAMYAKPAYEPMTPTQVAEAIVFAASTDHNACPDLIELKAVGQL